MATASSWPLFPVRRPLASMDAMLRKSVQFSEVTWGEMISMVGRAYFSVGTTMPRMMMFWQNTNTRKVGMAAMTREA